MRLVLLVAVLALVVGATGFLKSNAERNVMAWGPAALGAAATLGSALIGSRGSSRANDASLAAMRQQNEWQKEFAQHGIRWRVADAKAAGVHPLYAIGANVPTYSPVSMAFKNELAPFAAAGQDIGRSMAAVWTAKERAAATKEMTALQLRRAQLENDLLASQIARLDKSQIGPPMADPTKPSVPEAVKEELIPPPASDQPPIVQGQGGIRIPIPGGGSFETSRGRPAQQTVEDIAGGVIGELYGAGWTMYEIARELNRRFGWDIAAAKYKIGEWMEIRKSKRWREKHSGSLPRGRWQTERR